MEFAKRTVIKRHLKFAGVAAKTEKRYGRAIEDFQQFSDAFVWRVPQFSC